MKGIVILILIVVGINYSFGQDRQEDYFPVPEVMPLLNTPNPPKYVYGIYGGVAMSNILGTKNDSELRFTNEYYTNYNLGVSVEFIRIKESLSFTVELGLFYIRKGTLVSDYVTLDQNGQILADPIDIKNILNYLQLPININYKMFYSQNGAINLIGGVFVSYLLSNELKYLDFENTFDNEIKNKVDVGLNLGLNYEYRINSNGFVGISYDYQYGFISPIDNNYNNSSHVINLFYKFY